MRLITSLLAASSVALLAACGQASGPANAPVSAQAPANISTDAKVVAVLAYADWCGSCKTLDPKVESAKAANAFPNTEFVTLDYTAKDADAFFAAADSAGVGKAIREYYSEGVKTGLLLLVDMDDSVVRSVIRKDLTPEQIAVTITETAAQA